MDSAEIKLRCLELAISVGKAHANSNETAIVDIATKFYNYVGSCSKLEVKCKPAAKKDNQVDILT